MPSDGIVYVVDDDTSVRRALARLIASTGLDVETFPSAKTFLERPPTSRPACIVLDMRLGNESGLDLQAMLGNAQHRMPIIFLTGHATVPTTVHAMKQGALDFFQKPVDERELIDGIKRALRRSREAQAEEGARAEIRGRIDSLTRREREVLDLVVAGLLNKQIGERLGVSEKTVKVHRGRVMQKMAARAVADLVRMLHRLGPGPPELRSTPRA